MKQRFLLLLLCVCLLCPGLCAAAESETPLSQWKDGLFPVVILLWVGEHDTQPANILLIIVNSSTGKTMKATVTPGLFKFEGFDPQNKDTIAAALAMMEKKLCIPLDKYICVSLETLKALEPGSAKGKGVMDLIDMGMSLMDSVSTNLPLLLAADTFRLVYAKKDSGLVITLPQGESKSSGSAAEPDWEGIQNTLNQALTKLAAE